MKEIRTKLDVKMQNELNSKLKIFSNILIIVGFILIITGTIFMETSLFQIIFIGSIVLSLGLVLIKNIKNRLKQIIKSDKENIYTFENDFINVITFDGETKVGENKYFYKDIRKIKETKNYLFVFLDEVQCLPIDKNECLEDDLLSIKEKFNISRRKNEKD